MEEEYLPETYSFPNEVTDSVKKYEQPAETDRARCAGIRASSEK